MHCNLYLLLKNLIGLLKQVARFRKQRAAESKLQEIRERKERRRRSMQATAKAATVEHGEENLPDEDDEEEREVNSLVIIATGCSLKFPTGCSFIGVCMRG